jgi:hypothetical protein
MKRSIFLVVLAMAAVLTTVSAQAPARGQAGARPNIFAPAASATGPLADVMNSVVAAFNKRDTAYFDKLIAPDAVWLDEDGHHLLATVWMNRLLSANPARTLSITNVRTESWDTGGGPASLRTGSDQSGQRHQHHGLQGRRDWKIVMIHGAVDTAIVQYTETVARRHYSRISTNGGATNPQQFRIDGDAGSSDRDGAYSVPSLTNSNDQAKFCSAVYDAVKPPRRKGLMNPNSEATPERGGTPFPHDVERSSACGETRRSWSNYGRDSNSKEGSMTTTYEGGRVVPQPVWLDTENGR